jgi:TonB family protein
MCEGLRLRIAALRATSDGVCLPTTRSTPPSFVGNPTGRILKQPRPAYPLAARDQRIQGTVVLAAIIGKNGKITRLTYMSGPLALYESARSAVSQWEYSPYTRNGEATEVTAEIEVNYELQ